MRKYKDLINDKFFAFISNSITTVFLDFGICCFQLELAYELLINVKQGNVTRSPEILKCFTNGVRCTNDFWKSIRFKYKIFIKGFFNK